MYAKKDVRTSRRQSHDLALAEDLVCGVAPVIGDDRGRVCGRGLARSRRFVNWPYRRESLNELDSRRLSKCFQTENLHLQLHITITITYYNYNYNYKKAYNKFWAYRCESLNELDSRRLSKCFQARNLHLQLHITCTITYYNYNYNYNYKKHTITSGQIAASRLTSSILCRSAS